MLQKHSAAITAVNRLIEETETHRRGLKENSVLHRNFTIELEAYARVLNVLVQFQEFRGPDVSDSDRSIATGQATSGRVL